MANIKFSGFTSAASLTGTGELVGYDGVNNIRLTKANLETSLDLSNLSGSIDLTSQVTGVLPLTNGGTGASAQPAILDNVTDAASQPVDDIIVASAAGAIFQNPSQHPNIPVQCITEMSWSGSVNPYINFTNGSDVTIPFDSTQANFSTSTTIPRIAINFISPTETTFTPGFDGLYRVSVNLHFFDLYNDIDIFCGVYDLTAGGILTPLGGLMDKKDITGNTDQNFFGSSLVPMAAGIDYDIRATFSGGEGQNPFPSDSGELLTSVRIEYVVTP